MTFTYVVLLFSLTGLWPVCDKYIEFSSTPAGTMSQNEIFVQYLPLVLYEELTKESATRFLESKPWSLFLYIKRFCALVNADKLSEGQVQELDDIIQGMLQTRLDLVSGKGKQARQKHEFSWVIPKHVFLTHYPSIIRHAGTLKQYSTIRKESKNGELKRMAKVGNNKKNTLATLLNVDNKQQATSTYEGKFSDEPLTIAEVCLRPDESVTDYITHVWGTSSVILANLIEYNGIKYSNRYQHSVLVYTKDKKDFSVGVIRQLVAKSYGEPTVYVVYEETDKKFIGNLDVYEVTMKGKLGHAKITDLAHYKPSYLFQIKNKSLLTLYCVPYLK